MNLKVILLSVVLVVSIAIDGRADILQQRVSSENMCGAVALACAARAAGAPVNVEHLVEELTLDGQMKSFADLEFAAKKLGLATRVVHWRVNQSPEVPLPCIVRLVSGESRNQAHFVILLGAAPGTVRLFDPPNRPVWIAEEDLFREWDGVALYVANDAKELRAVTRGLPPLVRWGLLGLTIGGLGVLWHVGRGWRSIVRRHAGARSWLDLFMLSSIGWATIAFGFTFIFDNNSSYKHTTIAIDPPSLDLSVSEAELRETEGRVKGTFVLNNRSDREAVITRIVPNCTCASVTVTPNHRISAQGSTQIEVEVDLENEPSREAKVFVELEDAIPQQLTLRLQVRRESGLHGQPQNAAP